MKKLADRLKKSNIPLYLSAVLVMIALWIMPAGSLLPFDMHSSLWGPVYLLLIMLLFWQYSLFTHKSTIVFLVFCLWMYINAFITGENIVKALGGTMQRTWYFCVLVYLCAYLLEKKARQKWLICTFAGSLAVSSLIYVFGLSNALRALFDPAFESSTLLGIFRNGRISILGNANALGRLVLITLIEGLGLAYYFHHIRKKNALAILCLISVLLGYLMLSLSRSRASMLALAAGIGFYAFIIFYKDTKRESKWNFAKILGLSLLCILVSLSLSIFPKKAFDALVIHSASVSETVDAEEVRNLLTPYSLDYALDTMSDRTLIWSAVLRMMDEEPIRWLTGITTTNVHPNQIYDVYEGRPELTAYFSHSGYVEALLIFGLPGAFLLFVLLCLQLQALVRLLHSKEKTDPDVLLTIRFYIAALILALAEDVLLPYSSVSPVTCFFFLACGCCARLEQDRSESDAAGKRITKAVIILTAMLCFILALIKGVLPIASEETPADYVAYFNQKNRKSVTAGYITFDPEEIGSVFNTEVFLTLLSETAFHPSDSTDYRLNGLSVDSDYWQALENKQNIENLPRALPTSFGISTIRTVIKRFPTSDVILAVDAEGNTDNSEDEMLQSNLNPFAPVIVLHTTLDGQWSYILTYGCGGWVETESIALCHSKEEWLDRIHPENFLVVTAYEALISVKDSVVSLPMGTKLPLSTSLGLDGTAASEGPDGSSASNTIASNTTCLVMLPTRGADGMIVDIPAEIYPEEDYHAGYLPYTEENLRALALKHEGKAYGWAGSDNGFDCFGMTQSIYACFGFMLPRSAAAQANVTAAKTFKVHRDYGLGRTLNLGRNTVEYKLSVLRDAPVGTLLYFPGHIMIYLGMDDGKPMCISSVGSYSNRDLPVGTIVKVDRTEITDMTYITRANGKTWLECLEKIVILEP